MAAKTSKSKGKSNRGGRRPGAGRKPLEFTLLREQIAAESQKILGQNLPRLFENMLFLANGGFERVEEKFEPVTDKEGKTTLVVVERKVSHAEPDRNANEYLIDRYLGKPKQQIEHTGDEKQPISVVFEARVIQFYGDPK